MYKINIISAAFPNNTTSRDVYCKIVSQNDTVQTKVEMDTIQVAKWEQSFNIEKKSKEITFQLHLWKGENKDIILSQATLPWDKIDSNIGVPFNVEMKECEITIMIETVEENDKIKSFQKYLNDTGLEQAFKLIFAEILTKKIDKSEVFTYAVLRLRQIGDDLKMYINNNHKMSQLLNNISEVQQDEEQEQFLDSHDQ